jgi:glutathione S-transferase
MYGYSYPTATYPAATYGAGYGAATYAQPAQYYGYSAAPTVSYGYPATTGFGASVFGHPTYGVLPAVAEQPAKPAIKLTYFDSPGRAEAIRLAFFISGIQFEDVRVSKEEFASSGLKDRTPFGQLPVLEVGGQMIAQSYALLMFAGQLTGSLYPENIFERAKVNEALMLGEDLVQAFVPYIFEKDEERKASIRDKVVTEWIPKQLANLEKLLNETGSGFLAGPKMTIADISVWNYIHSFLEEGGYNQELAGAVDFTAYPKLSDLLQRFDACPKIAEWRAKEKARKEAAEAATTAAAAPVVEAPVTEEAAQE